MVSQDVFYSERPFFGTEHFPHGLAGSGEFSHIQVQLIETHGWAYQALEDGSRAPSNADEEHFVDVMNGQQDARTPHEKAWLRFKEKVNLRSQGYVAGSTQTADITRTINRSY